MNSPVTRGRRAKQLTSVPSENGKETVKSQKQAKTTAQKQSQTIDISSSNKSAEKFRDKVCFTIELSSLLYRIELASF